MSPEPKLSLPALGWIAVGALLRAGRVPCRWGEASWDYLAYHQPTYEALLRGDLRGALSFTGLHPPLYGLLLSAWSATLPIPLLALAASALLSAAAVWLVARAALILGGPGAAVGAAAFLAVSPVALAYAAEPLTYPLLSFGLAGALWAGARLQGAADKGGWGAFVALSAAAGWAHALGAAGALAAAASLDAPDRQRLRLLGGMLLLLLPLAWGAWHLLGQPVTVQPPRPWAIRASLFAERFFPLALLALGVVVLSLPGLPSRLRALRLPLGMMAGVAALLIASLLKGAAATHQFQYLTALTAPLAVVVGVGLGGGGVRARGALALCAALALGAAAGAAQDVAALAEGQASPRALDVALARSAPGDHLWLVTPARPDDDKRLISPVMWRLRPWWPMPALPPGEVDYADHRLGAPRLVGGRVVHLFHKAFDAQLGARLDALSAAGGALWLVGWDLDAEPALAPAVLSCLAARGARPTPVEGAAPGEGLWRVDLPGAP